MQSRATQAELDRARELGCSIPFQPYESMYNLRGPAPNGVAYYPNAPTPSLPYNSGAPASFQQVGHGGQEIGAYIHIPCIKKLHEAHCGLARTVTGLAETVTHLYNETRELREYIKRLKGDMDGMDLVPPLAEGPANHAMYPPTVSGSVAPSDSLSQRPSRQSSGSLEPREIQEENSPLLRMPHMQPAVRPDNLPFEVCWHREDCKLDTRGDRPIKSNSSRPRMMNAIREKDGTPIDKAYYKAIQKSVETQVAILIQEEEEERVKRSLPKEKITKKYFEKCRTAQWLHAIAVIEEEHPVLTYAASNWKADQMLTIQLARERTQRQKMAAGGYPSKKRKQTAKSNGKEDSSDESDSEETDDGGSREKVAAGSKRKRD